MNAGALEKRARALEDALGTGPVRALDLRAICYAVAAMEDRVAKLESKAEPHDRAADISALEQYLKLAESKASREEAHADVCGVSTHTAASTAAASEQRARDAEERWSAVSSEPIDWDRLAGDLEVCRVTRNVGAEQIRALGRERDALWEEVAQRRGALDIEIHKGMALRDLCEDAKRERDALRAELAKERKLRGVAVYERYKLMEAFDALKAQLATASKTIQWQIERKGT